LWLLPVIAGQNYLYRLKQIDLNGTEKYYNTISIDNTRGEKETPWKITNMIGQEVGGNYRGIVIEYYNDHIVKKNR
jgi:hypothetical protein